MYWPGSTFPTLLQIPSHPLLGLQKLTLHACFLATGCCRQVAWCISACPCHPPYFPMPSHYLLPSSPYLSPLPSLLLHLNLASSGQNVCADVDTCSRVVLSCSSLSSSLSLNLHLSLHSPDIMLVWPWTLHMLSFIAYAFWLLARLLRRCGWRTVAAGLSLVKAWLSRRGLPALFCRSPQNIVCGSGFNARCLLRRACCCAFAPSLYRHLPYATKFSGGRVFGLPLSFTWEEHRLDAAGL
jgi:hypothetical protein